MKNAISRQKGDVITMETYAAGAGNEYFPRVLSSVWRAYEKILAEHGGMDFDDLL